MVSTFLLLRALILDAGKEDEKEMEFDRWVLKVAVEYEKGIYYVVAKRVQGHVSEARHTFFLFLSLPTMEPDPIITLWD